jgi:hypothetical protein
VAYDGINQRFLVVWENDNLNNGIDIYGRFVNANGSFWNNEFCISNVLDFNLLIPAPEGQWNPAVAFDGVNQRFFVVWQDDRNPDSPPDIYGQMVNADGSFFGTGDNFVISDNLSGQWSPRLTYDSVNQIYLVAWVDYRNRLISGSDIYGQLVDKDGNLVGTSSGENRVISSAP